MREVLFTECYTLIDALIWWGLGFALAAGLFAPKKRGGRKDD